MKLFKCGYCGQVLYFENRTCENCGRRLGYLPDAAALLALERYGADSHIVNGQGALVRFCANAEFDVCNWLMPAESSETLCLCCRHNRTIPDTAVPENVEAWRKLETAKHRLFYAVLRLRLPLQNRTDAPEDGLAFDFPAELPSQPRVMTGHDNGLITIALSEANDAERESRRTAMHEPYRTLLGHFRHEIGHYYWDQLVRDGDMRDECRRVFGDDEADYGAALEAHYANGAPADWPLRFVSAYAASHPWEDFAESWAHYLHIVDTLETASALGMQVRPRLDKTGGLEARVEFDPYRERNLDPLIETWVPVSVALNCLNRSMGLSDAYPFVLSTPVIGKLNFIHELVRGVRRYQREAKSARPSPRPEQAQAFAP